MEAGSKTFLVRKLEALKAKNIKKGRSWLVPLEEEV